MPIPGPSPESSAATRILTGSPFWLQVNGVWQPAEGIVPTTSITTDRPRSTFTSVDGHRYEQRAPIGRRTWEWKIPFAASAHLALARIAAEVTSEVWLMSDDVASGNMLATRDSVGDETQAAIDCGGLPLRPLAAGAQIPARVRGGVPTTFSAWLTSTGVLSGGPWTGAGVAPFATITYPGGTATLYAGATPGQTSITVTPDADGPATIAIPFPPLGRLIAGPMLTEGTAPSVWTPGESMPCKVVVDDPDDTLRMHHTGAWRRDYTLSVREVG